MRIYLIGYMGSGKTSLGRIVAKRLGLSFVDIDHVIESKHCQSVAQLFAQKGEKAFRNIEQHVLHEVSAYENVLIATGGGTPCFFDNMSYMKQTGTTLYLDLTPKELTERLLQTNLQRRPLIADLSPIELETYIEKNLSSRRPFYQQATLSVGNGTDQEMVEAMLVAIKGVQK